MEKDCKGTRGSDTIDPKLLQDRTPEILRERTLVPSAMSPDRGTGACGCSYTLYSYLCSDSEEWALQRVSHIWMAGLAGSPTLSRQLIQPGVRDRDLELESKKCYSLSRSS